jgi:hypothetical protein
MNMPPESESGHFQTGFVRGNQVKKTLAKEWLFDLRYTSRYTITMPICHGRGRECRVSSSPPFLFKRLQKTLHPGVGTKRYQKGTT